MESRNGLRLMSDRPGMIVLKATAKAGAIGIAKAVLRIDPTSPEDLSRRVAICEACPSGCYLSGPSRCDRSKGGCGCFLAAKWRVASEKCPKGHW
jgi:hypothetical protein